MPQGAGKEGTKLLPAGEVVRAALVQCRIRGVKSYVEMEQLIIENADKLIR
jgi:hypothetical protein